MLFLILFYLTIVNSQYFIHITDIHYDPLYAPGSPTNCWLGDTGLGCCRKDSVPLNPPGNASIWGDFNCDSPYLLVKNTIDWIRNNLNYDFVIYTGDTVNHHDLSQNWDSNFKDITNITYLLQTMKTPVYHVLGNHDSFLVDQLYTVSPVVSDVGSLWDNDTITNGARIQNFTQGGFYKTTLPSGINLCGINSLWYDSNNLAVIADPTGDIGGQFEWMKENVNGCFLIGHIAPTSGEASTQYDKFMLTVNLTHELYGHTHSDEYIIVNSSYGLRVGWMPASVVPNNHFPAFRRFKYMIKNESMVILDYEEYHHNLTRQQTLPEDKFIGYEITYTALNEYGLKDMSAGEWWNLALRMVYNDTLLGIYCKNNNYPNTTCVREDLLCGINQSLC